MTAKYASAGANISVNNRSVRSAFWSVTVQ